MAFQRIRKSRRHLGDLPASITIAPNSKTSYGKSRQMYLHLSIKTRQMLGEPAAVFLDWDPDEWLLRVAVAPADDPDAYPVGKNNRVGITTAARELGLVWDVPVTVEIRPDGRTAVIGDFSQVRTVTSIRKAA